MTPSWLGHRPVSQLARAGTHWGDAVRQRLGRTLVRASRLRWGSCSCGWLSQSPRHWSKLTSNQWVDSAVAKRGDTEAMPHPHRYWFALHPDLSRPIGGAKQVHRLVEALGTLQREATIIQQEASFHPGWFSSQVATIGLEQFQARGDLRPDRDVIVLPETFLAALPRYAPGLPKLVFNQNGAYSFGLKPGDGFPKPEQVLELYRHADLKHVLCISKHDEQLLKQAFPMGPDRVSRIVNGIETDLFRLAGTKQRRIAYMPRKNGRDAAIVAALLANQRWFREGGWSLQAIDGLPQPQVAAALQQSLVFLAFGHPEGFGLPLAEAAACGCYLIGYSGLGGAELLELAQRHSAGEEVAFGNWLGFVQACQRLHTRLGNDQDGLARCLVAQSKAVRTGYSAQAMQQSVAIALQRWEQHLP